MKNIILIITLICFIGCEDTITPSQDYNDDTISNIQETSISPGHLRCEAHFFVVEANKLVYDCQADYQRLWEMYYKLFKDM